MAGFGCSIAYFFSGLTLLLQAEPLKNCNKKKTFCAAVYPEQASLSCSLVADTEDTSLHLHEAG